jgi:hypothetical protein
MVSPVFARIGRAQLPVGGMGETNDVIDRGLDLDSHADMAVLGSNCVVSKKQVERSTYFLTIQSWVPRNGKW